MKSKILTLLFGLLSVLSHAQKERTNSDIIYFKWINSFDIDFNMVYPIAPDYIKSPIENHWGLGFQFNVLSFPIGKHVEISQQLGYTFGGKNYKTLVDDVLFEGGYTGGLRVDYYRGNFYGGSTVRIFLNKNLQLNFPFNLAGRFVNYQGQYYLDENQTINPEDIALGEQSGPKIEKFYRNFSWGFKTGVEFAVGVNGEASLFARLNYQYFGPRDVYDVQGVSHPNDGPITFPVTSVNNSSELGFSLGIRAYGFRIGKHEDKPRDKQPDIDLKPDQRSKR